MSDLSCGISGSTGAEVVARINENTNNLSDLKTPSASIWDGAVLADQQALRDFYGEQTITVVGGNFSAKSYPDGSVLGFTDNGKFEMSANGTLFMSQNITTPTFGAGTEIAGKWVSAPYEVSYPVIHVGTTTGGIGFIDDGTAEYWLSVIAYDSDSRWEVKAYNNATFSTGVGITSFEVSCIGRWK